MGLLIPEKDRRQLLPMEFPWAYARYQAGCANHWSPREISMQEDINLWNSQNGLTDTERRVVKTNLGFFAASESMVADNIALQLYNDIANPECRMFLGRQIFEEEIHTDAFMYICTSLLLDEDEMYTMYRDLEEIESRHRLLNNSQLDCKRAGSRLLADLVKYYIVLEGILFYTGFAQLLSLGARNKMNGICEMITYIARDESVHIGFGIDVINQIRREMDNLDPEGFAVWVKSVVVEAVRLEKKVSANRILRDPLPGLDLESCMEYVEFVADRRLVQLGLAPIYYRNESPLPWLSAMMDAGKEQNFFESHVTNYKSAGTLEWD